ncbi:MAG: DUF2513 domain-containing protein [Lachnospiraceae bacterium]|nr:DUF2513 domain-containing protein [Lachnospiraceae bacterium]
MKLEPNCVRDILLFCEKSLGINADLSWETLHLPNFCQSLPSYTKETIAYTLILLDEAGYINCHVIEADNGIVDIYVFRLTYFGHEFIETIRSNSVWEKLTSCVAKIGSASLPVIQQLGSSILLDTLKSI